jgi:hypothetical protein
MEAVVMGEFGVRKEFKPIIRGLITEGAEELFYFLIGAFGFSIRLGVIVSRL